MRKRKAEDALREYREAFEREQRVSREIFEATYEGLIRPLINYGLVDDVEPEGGVAVPEPPFYCGQCGAQFPAADFCELARTGCTNCGSIIWRFEP